MSFNPDEFLAQTQASMQPSETATPSAVAQPLPPQVDGFNPDEFLAEAEKAKYETPEQLGKTFAEGAGEAALGPVFTLAQRAANVNPEDIKGRKEANPVTYGVGQVTGLGASLLTGVGEGALVAKAGQSAAKAAGLAKAEGILGKMAAEGIDQATQLALMQGSDEISRMIVNDPEQTAQNSIANVGLAAALGGVTGAAIGSINPLWKASGLGEKTSKFAKEFQDEIKFLRENPEPVAQAVKEVEELHLNTQTLKESLYNNGLKGDLIKAKLPEITPVNTEKLHNQVTTIVEQLDDAIKFADKNPKTGQAARFLEYDKEQFLNKIKSGESYQDAYDAINELKKSFQGYAKKGGAYGASIEASEFGQLAGKLGSELKPMLEDPKVWGDAAKVQSEFNKAFSEFSQSAAEKDFLKTFTNIVGDERVINPAKLDTFVRQVGKPNAEIKAEILNNYIKEYEKFANRINKIAVEMGEDELVSPHSLNTLKKLMGEKTAGAEFAQQLVNKLGDKTAGKLAGASTGAGLGASVFGPVGGAAGAVIGEHALSPILSSVFNGLTKSILEGSASGGALKSSLDFAMQAAKSAQAMTKASMNVMKPGAQVLAVSMIPSDNDRKKLDKIVDEINTMPDKLTKLDNGKLGNLMPQHQAAMSATVTKAATYLASIKPRPYKPSPLDQEVQPTAAQMQRYNRALDIAQQPAIVLQHVKDGTLQMTDIQDLTAMYPALYRQMTQTLSNELMNKQAKKNPQLPYVTKMGLSMFLAQPLDSNMTPHAMQLTQMTFNNAKQQRSQGGDAVRPSQKGMSHLGKAESMYFTPSQNRAARKIKD